MTNLVSAAREVLLQDLWDEGCDCKRCSSLDALAAAVKASDEPPAEPRTYTSAQLQDWSTPELTKIREEFCRDLAAAVQADAEPRAESGPGGDCYHCGPREIAEGRCLCARRNLL